MQYCPKDSKKSSKKKKLEKKQKKEKLEFKKINPMKTFSILYQR